MFMETRIPVQDSAVCTRPMSMAYASPICRRREPQRRAALCNHGREESWFNARAQTSHTDSRLPSVGVDRSALGQVLCWEDDLSATESQFDDPPEMQWGPIESPSQVVKK